MKKRIICLLLILLSLLAITCFATENDVMLISEEIKTENMDGDKYIFEEKSYILQDQNINGNVFAFVQDSLVINNTTINGNLFVFSNNVSIENTVISGSIFSFSTKLDIISSQINDIYALSGIVNLDSIINREVKIFADDVKINGTINGKSYISANNVKIEDGAVLNNIAEIKYSGIYEKSENITNSNINASKIEKEQEEPTVKQQALGELKYWVIELIKTFVIAGFVILFTKGRFEEFSKEITGKKFAVHTLKGLLWLILIPIISIIVMFISKGYLIGLPIVAIIIYSIIIYLSLQIVSIALGYAVKNKYMGDKSGNLELIGVILIVMSVLWLLQKLPIVGIIISLIIACASVGIMIKYIFGNKKDDEVIVKLEEK